MKDKQVLSAVGIVLFLSGLLAAQVAGNTTVYSSSSTFAPVTNELHTAGYSSLAATLAACPSAPTPCHVIIDPSATPYTVSAPLIIGSTSQAVDVDVHDATLECTGTSGQDCIDINNFGSLRCDHYGSSESGCVITSGSGADVTSLVANDIKTGTQTNFFFSGFRVYPSGTSTVSHALLWIKAIEGKAVVRDLSIGGLGTSNGSSGLNISIEDADSGGGDMNALEMDNVWSLCDGLVGCVGLNLVGSGTGTGAGANYLFNGLTVVDSLEGSGCRSGNGCLINIDGAAGSSSSHYISGITFNNLYLETTSTTSTTGNFVDINNVRSLSMNEVYLNGGQPQVNGFLITQTTSNLDGLIRLNGRSPIKMTTNVINNQITSYASPNTSGVDFDYIYPGGQSTGVYVDGVGITNVPTVGAPTVGHASCIKSSGPPVVIGYCSTMVLSTGSCTCN
ncbi:MAG: hypothetical protein WAM13_15710 [Candidatus Sulfotelmatobacter sp.]